MKTRSSLHAFAVVVAILVGAPPTLQAAPLNLTFVNENTTYAHDDVWILFSYTGSSASDFAGTVKGTGPESGTIAFTAGAGPSAGSYFSKVYRITDLPEGVEITKTPSTRIYVSLGKKLDDKRATLTPDNPFSFFGSPSPTASADPNWNTRWDFFETTLSDPRSADDYGDISAINQFAIPLQVDLYKSATELTPENLLQSARSAANPGALATQLKALAVANVANNNSGLDGNWFFETPTGSPTPENPYPGTFLRMVGPASGGTTPEWIGPFPSLNDYATFVANAGGTPISATLTDTTSVAATFQQTYTMTTTAWLSDTQEVEGIKVSGSIATSTWDAGSTTWNPAVTDPRTFEMRIALDTDVGAASGANYSLSNALYGSAWQGNSGVTYWITDGGVTTSYDKADFLTEVSSNSTMALQTVNQWMHDLYVGYDFGLIGNTATVSHLPGGHHLQGVTLNDMGSAGWRELSALINVGTVATEDVPFFTLTDGQGHKLYNQWAKIVFDNSQTVYGMQYSDMFQPLLALYSYQTNFLDNVYQSTVEDVLTWKVTILAPEAEAVASAAAALGALAAIGRRRRREKGRS